MVFSNRRSSTTTPTPSYHLLTKSSPPNRKQHRRQQQQQQQQELQDNDVVAAIMNSISSSNDYYTNNSNHHHHHQYRFDGSITSIGSSSITGGSSSSSSSSSPSSSSPASRSEIGRLADVFIMYVDVRDRKYKTKTYKDCFIGSEAVDAIMYAGLARTRQDALLLGRRLQDELRLFSHVKNDHDFKDDYLFYSFNSINMKTSIPQQHDSESISKNGSSTNSTWATSTTTSHTPTTIIEEKFPDLEEKAKKFYQLANVQDRTHRLKKYRLVFVGSEVVDMMVYNGLAETRWEAVQLGRAMAKHLDLFEHVEKKHTFADGYFFFKFTSGALRLIGKMNSTARPDVITTSPTTPVGFDLSDHTTDNDDDDDDVGEATSPAPVVDLSVFKKARKQKKVATKNRGQFKYPEPLPALTECSEDTSDSGRESPIDTCHRMVGKPIGLKPSREELLLKKIKNGLRYTYPEELLEEWQVVLAELKSELKSFYTGHHTVIDSNQALAPKHVVHESQAEKRISLSDSITTINNMTPTNGEIKKDLLRSFSAFESIVRKNATLTDASVWTEYVVEDDDEGDFNGKKDKATTDQYHNQDDPSYDEFTVLEEVTVDASYIEETIAETQPSQRSHHQSPNTVLKPPVVITPPKTLDNENANGYKTIIVNNDQIDDDMTAITLDHYFSGVTPAKFVPVATKNTPRPSCQRSVCSQETGGATKQQIISTIRTKLFSSDVDVVVSSLKTLCAEVDTTNECTTKDSHRAFIVQCGGVMAVLRTIEMYPQNEAVQYYGCSVLRHLATEPNNKDLINELDGIPAVAQSMQLHGQSARVNEAARACLSALL